MRTSSAISTERVNITLLSMNEMRTTIYICTSASFSIPHVRKSRNINIRWQEEQAVLKSQPMYTH